MTMQAIEKTTLSDKITRLLRENIVSGQLPAGHQLKQEELSERFGVSMSALREALRTLSSDGLVTMMPNRGAQVSDLSAEEATDIFDIRKFLEIGALELAIPNLSEKNLSSAEKTIAKIDAVRDASKLSALNRQFHDAIYMASGRPKLITMINNMHDNVARYLCLYLDTLNFQADSQMEHRELLEACRRRDIEEARHILRKHLSHAREQLVQYLNGRDK
ncbi:GntR family transcriptional regulator [Deltaproteobacteria bacterium Smac51]|nr:GntR family transcriptional regulator [Deltaproteobacteria bacterium Smac51]